MYNLTISPHTPVTIEIRYFGLLSASYVYSLWEMNSNLKVDTKHGNNLNSADDIFQLPVPNSNNVGRLVELFSTLNNPEPDARPEIVAINIIQDNTVLFTDEKPDGFKFDGDTFTIAESKSVAANSTALNDIFILLK